MTQPNNVDKAVTREDVDVCDDCLMVAYDNGFVGYEAQASAMVLLGREIEDHDCIRSIEPEMVAAGEAKCECSCQ